MPPLGIRGDNVGLLRFRLLKSPDIMTEVVSVVPSPDFTAGRGGGITSVRWLAREAVEIPAAFTGRARIYHISGF